MSYSTSRAGALDAARPLAHRASHARSCAALVAEKLGVPRGEIFRRVHDATGVDMAAPASGGEIEAALHCLDALRMHG